MKPLRPNELFAKIEFLLQRRQIITSALQTDMPPAAAGLQLDSTNLTVQLGMLQSAPLTSTEFKIIALLHRSPSLQCPRDELKLKIWEDVKVSDKALDVHMTNLRKKIIPLNLRIMQLNSGIFALLRGNSGPSDSLLNLSK